MIADYGLLPLYSTRVWAMRHDLTYAGRADQMTLAQLMTSRKLRRASASCRATNSGARHSSAAHFS